jgi:O-antigen/teichoic acid export membrane protein
MQDNILSGKVARGGLWLFTLRFVSRGLGFFRTIILARLLTPADFGLIGIAMTVIVTLDFLSQTGFQTALIQKKDCSRAHMDTAWTLLVVRGTVLFFIVIFISPFVAKFFNTPNIDLVIKVIAISVIFSGFRNIGIISFYKDLRYDRHFKFEICGALIDLVISVGLAFLLRNVWAIIWGGFAGNLMRLMMSYLLSDYRPKFSINPASFRELFSFGKWILISGIVYAMLTQADSMTIGKLLGPAALGFYQMAMLIAYLPSSEISTVAAQITLPAYSIMQNDLQRLKFAYLDVLRFATFLSLPIGALIFILSPEFIILFLGENWLPAVTCTKMLVFSGTLISITSIAMPIFSAKGIPKIETYLQTGNLLILLVLLYPLTIYYGINGTALAILAGNVTVMVISLYYVAHLTGATIRSILSIITFTFVNVAIMTLSVYGIKHLVPWDGFLQFFLCIFVALAVYLLSTVILDKITGYGIVLLIKEKTRVFLEQKK